MILNNIDPFDAGSRFPWDIFEPETYQSFKNISKNENIPLDFLGVQALFSVAALSGNMYVGDLNGTVKPIIFIAKIGPSGVGKTPAFHKLLGDIITPLRLKHAEAHEIAVKEWVTRQRDSQKAKMDFDEEKPAKKVRLIEGGTVEAIAKHSITSPAGFAVIYDEGERMFGELNKYNNGGSGLAFWNEAFNGKPVELVRVDSDRERFVKHPAVCVDIGLQSERMSKYFTSDAIESGILNRFLMVESDYIELNENVDLSARQNLISEDWARLVKYLYEQGMNYEAGKPEIVRVDDAAWPLLNNYAKLMIRKSNMVIKDIKPGDSSSYLSAYRAKLYTYFKRFLLILAILRDPKKPKITEWEIKGSKKLCIYFESNAIKIINRLYESSDSGLNANEKSLYEMLPNEFNSAQAVAICDVLGLNITFFNTTFRRKYSKGYIIKRGRGNYEKI